MSENLDHTSQTSEEAPFKEDDFPQDYFDDSNEAATFEGSPVESDFEPEFEGHSANGTMDTLPTAPQATKRVLRGKIGKPEEVPPPGGLVPLSLATLAFVSIGTWFLYGTKPDSTAPASSSPVAATATPEPAVAQAATTPPAPTPTATVMAPAPTPAAETAKPVEAPTEPVASTTAPAPTPASAETPAPQPTPAQPSLTEALAADLKATEERLTALSNKIDALPKPEPPADLKPLEDKLAEQSKSIENLVPVPEKLGKIEETVGGLNQSVDSIKREIESLKEAVKKATEALAALATATAKPAAVAPAEPEAKNAEFDNAAGLFKAGKYNDSEAIFAKLAAANPNDARVFYFAALAKGSAKAIWTGETETLVNKGIDLEKAGSPKKDEIDAAFADLLPQLKTWLDAYRKRANQ